ncbi:unnamed protein product, partial [Ectocarpus fasciculatus]
MALLGRGASGQVWKVVNRLDKRTYAVKKILLDSNDSVLNKKIRREVTTISRLLHNHIVRYYAAWYESAAKVAPQDAPVAGSDNSESTSGSDSSSSESSTSSDSDEESDDDEEEDADDVTSVDSDCDIIFEDSGGIGFGNMLSNHSSHHGRSMHKRGGSSSGAYWKPQSSGQDGVEAKIGVIDLAALESNILESPLEGLDGVTPASSNDVVKCLYLQMEFCETTLREFIDSEKLWKKPDEVFRLLSQLLDALTYIHGKGMIHRDLKPANIFLDHFNNIKIGDFGLATTTTRSKAEVESTLPLLDEIEGQEDSLKLSPQKKEKKIDFSEYAILVQPDGSTANRSASAYMWDSLTGGVGTAMYCAPEQAVSSRRRGVKASDGSTLAYDSKADMFSLGVILFEMCRKPFSTGMERISTLKDLRDLAKLPDDFVNVVPENLCKIIVSLVQQDPAARPSAVELSSSSLMQGKINIDKSYLREITDSILNPRSEMLSEIISAL